MLWVKRLICGIVALIIGGGGIYLIMLDTQIWQAVGFCLFVVGLALGYIAVTQKMPRYNFWITLIAVGLCYALYTTNSGNKTDVSSIRPQSVTNNDVTEPKKENKIPQKKKPKKKSKLSSYPKITGRAEVIHANVFYISGRYVRLFGVDAPDSDQICSDINGSSYNCGQEAISWVRGWIDDNKIDCYLLKVNPKGQDLATCVWGDYDIGAALVGAGWAIANTSETNIYAPYEAKAQSELSGLWQGSFYSPEDWRNIKRDTNNFTIKKHSKGGFFNFKSLF